METKETWWVDGSTIVSNTPTGHDDLENVRAYRGHLIAESVCNKWGPLLVNARRLWFALAEIVINSPEERFADAYQVLCDTDPDGKLRGLLDPTSAESNEPQHAPAPEAEPVRPAREAEIDIGDFVYTFRDTGGPVCQLSREWQRWTVLKKRLEYGDSDTKESHELLLKNSDGTHWRGLDDVYTTEMAKRFVNQLAETFFINREGK